MHVIELNTIEAYLNCKYKAYLLSNAKTGVKSEYELLFTELRKTYKDIFLTDTNRSKVKSYSIRFNYCKYSGKFNLNLDAIKFTVISKQSKFCECIPYFIVPNEKVTATQKLLASFVCLILNDENYQSHTARIVYGSGQKTTNISLNNYIDKSQRLLRDIDESFNNNEEPARYKIKHCQICEFNDACYAEFRKIDCLSLIGLGVKKISKLHNKGIFTVNQLSYTYRPRHRKKKVVKPDRLEYSLKALALREKKTFVIDCPTFQAPDWEIYLDFEGLADESFWYLIGLLVVNKKTGSRIKKSFWADNLEDTEKIFQKLSTTIFSLKNFTIYHYGSYELQVLKKVNKKLNGQFDNLLDALLKDGVNILPFFTSDLYPPTYTNGLKDIARYIGFNWSDENASGLQSIVWRKKWELTNSEQIKKKLIEYNQNDCEALFVVKTWIQNISKRDTTSEDEQFAKTDDLPNNVSYKKWGDPNFVNTDFKEINKFAYFDYQREKVYIRSNKKVRSAVRKSKNKLSVVNQIDKVINYVPTDCSVCGHDKFYILEPRKKIHIDLKFMKNGVKRWDTLLPGSSFKCESCGDEFSPYKFGHNLLIWTMDQYMTHMVSIPKIGNMLTEQFNIFVPENVRYQFKSALAEEYRETYDRIKQELLNGPLIHIDETKTELIDESNGYVWVMASMDTVYYFYRPNRKTHFLKEFLTGFAGVLVSDFYSGYDSLPCNQQKCLIHLIRDLNNDLLVNQMNSEYKEIVTEFGKLLRTIIATVDKYGLKQRNLKKHNKEVENFYARLLNANYNTDLAMHWQKRFKKNKGKLFNFLNFDGIPWNNNNAESAIKPFAKYRRKVKGTIRESGLEDYLILLSIQQTCKYRGINFLEFLKSKKKFFP